MKIIKWIKASRFKICVILLVSIASILLVISNVSTYSWFADSEAVQITATVATAEDFITVGEVINQPPDIQGKIPAYIKIIKNCSEDITVSFELQGEVAKYLAPISPRLLSNKENIIPINVIATNDNYYALVDLYNKNNKQDSILVGTISVKCFNEFINETRKIEMSSNYLRIKTLGQLPK